jgi:hypothetical protein
LSISARDLAKMIMQNCHNTLRAKTVNQQLIEYEHIDQFYWKVDRNTLIGHQLPISLIGMRPERHVSNVNTFWDWGMVYEFCPSKRLTAIVDSDDFLMMELRPELRSIESLRLGRTTPRDIAKRTTSYMTQYQVDNAAFQLLLHSSNLPKDLPPAQQSLKEFVGSVLKNLPRRPIDHHNHAQWRYHKKHFRARLRERLGAGLTRRRKGEALARGDACKAEQLLEETRSLLRRIDEISHPYKDSRGALQKLLRPLAHRNASILLVCDDDSYLLHALDNFAGLQTHLTPDIALDGLHCLPRTGAKIDACLIEMAGVSFNLLEVFDAVTPMLRESDGRLLLLWHNRSTADLRRAVTEMMRIITLRQLEFDLDYSVSWISTLASRFLAVAERPRDKFGLNYPLKWLAFAAGTSLALACQLKPPLSSRKPRYLTRNCSSVMVDLHVDQRLAALLPRRPHVARSKVLLRTWSCISIRIRNLRNG